MPRPAPAFVTAQWTVASFDPMAQMATASFWLRSAPSTPPAL